MLFNLPVMWGEVQAEKTLESGNFGLLCGPKAAGRPVGEDELNEERGNPLIGSLGRTGGNSSTCWLTATPMTSLWTSVNLRAILCLPACNDGPSRFFDQPEERKPLSRTDESVTINSCHGPMREAEVLRDYLLRRFAEDPTLRPRDVVVMMPDPEGYAPYLRAAFGGMEEGMPKHFPYSIVDREPERRVKSSLLLWVVGVFRGPTPSKEVWICSTVGFRLRFGLDDEDMEAFDGFGNACPLGVGRRS